MLHRAADFGLALQPLIELGGFALVLEGLLYLDCFESHPTADAAVARQVDHSHGSFAEDRFDFVISEIATGVAGEFSHFFVQRS